MIRNCKALKASLILWPNLIKYLYTAHPYTSFNHPILITPVPWSPRVLLILIVNLSMTRHPSVPVPNKTQHMHQKEPVDMLRPKRSFNILETRKLYSNFGSFFSSHHFLQELISDIDDWFREALKAKDNCTSTLKNEWITDLGNNEKDVYSYRSRI